ncbi:hypothetical protein JKI95_09315 [Corynebacterium aquatimens]|uniref:hypothetical protein n=1 Tax=Corynebacterium TaxID=1716 RepID=UPI001F173E6E|nr:MULTISPECIES: hypothetical protein [Corynebacterium]QYH19327.1 hypothetical protein JKI95_09315 [Corynebacterium aquatimens]UIZ91777.1 hypothetical protein JZY91_08590 [Corynebacterium sp. CNCTC7651]
MSEQTSRPPKSEDSIDQLGDPDATHQVQEEASADETANNTDITGNGASDATEEK